MIKSPMYHGTSYGIEYWDFTHVGTGEGNSVFPGIYFTPNYQEALEYAKLSSQKTGNPPIVYVAELDLGDSGILNLNEKYIDYFNSIGTFYNFVREYFPNWFGEGIPDPITKAINPEKKGYVEEKYKSRFGQLSLIYYAARENNISAVEIMRDIGWYSCLDGSHVVITDANQILSFEKVEEPKITEDFQKQSSFEAIAERYIVDSKNAKKYRTKPGNRYKRRMMIRQNGGNRVWYDIDVNKFIRNDEFTWHIPVIGETDDYVVGFSLKNWLPVLRHDIKQEGFSVNTFKKSLGRAMRTLELKSECNCDDYKYRIAYWATRKGDKLGDPENRPSNITNPNDDLGRHCKHGLFLISNRIWLERIGRILFNYCYNLWKQNKRLFELTIGKKLEITDDMIENRPIRKTHKNIQEQPKQEDNSADVTDQDNQNFSDSKEPADEAYNDSYKNNKEFDEDQQMIIDLANDEGVDVSEYITPKNTPDQIWEVTRSIQGNIPENIIILLSNPELSPAEIQVLREAYQKGYNLFKYIGYDADVLKQLLAGAKQGINPEVLVTHGMNARQIEQLRIAYLLDKNLYMKLRQSSLNYEGMRKFISKWRQEHAKN